jgi:putative FmdB family regulatory protein
MPIFEYICKDCQHEFEALLFGKQKAECPKCQSKKLEPQLSVFAVSSKGGAARMHPRERAVRAAILGGRERARWKTDSSHGSDRARDGHSLADYFGGL